MFVCVCVCVHTCMLALVSLVCSGEFESFSDGKVSGTRVTLPSLFIPVIRISDALFMLPFSVLLVGLIDEYFCCIKKKVTGEKSLYGKEWKQLWTNWKWHVFTFLVPGVKFMKNYSITLYIYVSVCMLFLLEWMRLQYRKRRKKCMLYCPTLYICIPRLGRHNYASWF